MHGALKVEEMYPGVADDADSSRAPHEKILSPLVSMYINTAVPVVPVNMHGNENCFHDVLRVASVHQVTEMDPDGPS